MTCFLLGCVIRAKQQVCIFDSGTFCFLRVFNRNRPTSNIQKQLRNQTRTTNILIFGTKLFDFLHKTHKTGTFWKRNHRSKWFQSAVTQLFRIFSDQIFHGIIFDPKRSESHEGGINSQIMASKIMNVKPSEFIKINPDDRFKVKLLFFWIKQSE
jgi:hypothetical protein